VIDQFQPERSTYELFIEGELVDLCIPNTSAIDNDGWHSWFNKISDLQYTGHGIFPNTRAKQEAFLQNLDDNQRLVLLVCKKTDKSAVGVVSLENIDLTFRQALFAINIGIPEKLASPGLAALEAVALISEHGFKELGLNRIHGGQAYPGLRSWNQLLEIIGYQTDGIERKAMRRGNQYYDKLEISLLYDDYLELLDHRGGLWPSLSEIKKLLKKQPSISFAEKLDDEIIKIRKDHFKYLFE
jgi:RimJ/RimL family protein N-acetyltransferase